MATPPRSFSLIPWLLCLLLGAGWYFAAHPDALPLGGLLKRSGLAATSRQRMLAAWSSVGFDTTAVGQRWRRIGDSVLLAPQPTQLPLSLRAYFGDEPDATAWTFLVPAGTVLPVLVESSLLDGEPLIELYRQVPSGDSTVLELLAELHAGADTLRPAVDADAQLVLRVEATPLAQGNVRVRISTAPALGVFPVEGAGLREVHSRWGAERDGGGRRHEGIDIFRPKGTPLAGRRSRHRAQHQRGRLGGEASLASGGGAAAVAVLCSSRRVASGSRRTGGGWRHCGHGGQHRQCTHDAATLAFRRVYPSRCCRPAAVCRAGRGGATSFRRRARSQLRPPVWAAVWAVGLYAFRQNCTYARSRRPMRRRVCG